MVNKRSNPDFHKIGGYVPSALYIAFRQQLITNGLNLNEGLEKALEVYLSQSDTTPCHIGSQKQAQHTDAQTNKTHHKKSHLKSQSQQDLIGEFNL